MRVVILKVLYPLLAFTTFINPFYGIIYYTFISVVRPEQLTYGNHNISGVFALAISTLFLSCFIKREKLIVSVTEGYFVYFILFVVGLTLSTLLSPYTDFSERKGSIYYLQQFPQILLFCICLHAVLLRLVDTQIQNYIVILVAFFLFMGVWAIDQYFRGNELIEQLFGTSITDRCAITGVFILYFPLAVYFTKKKTNLLKLFGFMGIVVFFTDVVLTQSRAGFLGFVGMLLAMFYFSNSKKKFLVYSFLALSIGLLFVPDTYFDRIHAIKSQNIHDNEITDKSSASRLLMWEVGWEMFKDHPITGVGNLNFSNANKKYAASLGGSVDSTLLSYTFGNEGQRGLTHTHNTYLNILVEGGLISSVPFFMVMILPLWRGFRLTAICKDSPNNHVLDQLELMNLINCGVIGFMIAAFFSNMILVDYFYWNLTISYFLSRNIEAGYRENKFDKDTLPEKIFMQEGSRG